MSEKLQNTSCFKYIWVFMVGLVLLAACAGEPTVDPLDIGDPVRGRQLFEGGEPLNNGCIECHSLDGSDDLAPTMLGLSDRAGERVPAAGRSRSPRPGPGRLPGPLPSAH